MTKVGADNRPTFGLADGSTFRAAAALLPTDPVGAIRVWREVAVGGPHRSAMMRRRLMLEAEALSRILAANDEDPAMSASDDRRTASQALAEACRELVVSSSSAPPAIGMDWGKRPLTQREVGWLQEFNLKMADLGRSGMEHFLRDISRRLRRHETRASLAFRPLRFSNELPVMPQLAEMWREGVAREQTWSNMLHRIVLQQIGRKEPPDTDDDWSFLRDAWRLAGVMDLERSPAAAARNQIDAFRRRGAPDEVEFAGLLAIIDRAVAADMARSKPRELSAILLFRRQLAVEPNAPANSAARLLEAWTASNRISMEMERQWSDDEDRLGEDELRRKITKDWMDMSKDPGIRHILQALTTDAAEVGACWSEAAELIFGRPMAMDEAKERLLSSLPETEADFSYRSPDDLRALAA